MSNLPENFNNQSKNYCTKCKLISRQTKISITKVKIICTKCIRAPLHTLPKESFSSIRHRNHFALDVENGAWWWVLLFHPHLQWFCMCVLHVFVSDLNLFCRVHSAVSLRMLHRPCGDTWWSCRALLRAQLLPRLYKRRWVSESIFEPFRPLGLGLKRVWNHLKIRFLDSNSLSPTPAAIGTFDFDTLHRQCNPEKGEVLAIALSRKVKRGFRDCPLCRRPYSVKDGYKKNAKLQKTMETLQVILQPFRISFCNLPSPHPYRLLKLHGTRRLHTLEW